MRAIETITRLLLLWLFLISLPFLTLLIAAYIVPGIRMYLAIYGSVAFLAVFAFIGDTSEFVLIGLILGLMVLFFYIFYVKLRYHALAASLICVFLSFIILQSLRSYISYDSGYYHFFTEIKGPKLSFYKIMGLIGGLILYCIGVRILAKRCLSALMKMFISTLLWVLLFSTVTLLFVYDGLKVYDNIITVIAIIVVLSMYFLGGFFLKERPFFKGTSRFMKIFFSTLLWMAVFDVYTVSVVFDLIFKEGGDIKTRGDYAIISFLFLMGGSIQFYLPMIIIFLWNFWLLLWGHYYLIIKKIKNPRVYYLTSMLYILSIGALWLINILHTFDENILGFWKKHILQPYLLIYVLTAFLLAFFQRRQFKDLSKAKTPSDDFRL